MTISIHTFELTLKPMQKYDELRLLAYAKAEGSHRIFKGKNDSDYRNVYVDEALKRFGIKVEFHELFWLDQNAIKVIVNPSKVLGGDDIPKLWKPTSRNIKTLLKRLKAHIKDYFDSKCKLNDFELSRVDLTANVDVGSRDMVSNYIKIMHSLGKVKGYSPKYKKTNKRIDKSLSFDLKSKARCIEFSVYDKEAQSGRKEAKGILRIEIRLINIKIKEGNTAEQIMELSSRSRKIFMNHFQCVVPRGDYYTKKQAVALIEDKISTMVSDIRARKNILAKMKELIELIPVKKSLYLAQKTMDYREKERLLSAFAELNVSPITISKNMKIKHLKSLYSFLDK